MRKIDWSRKLTKEDIAWVNQAGILYVQGLPVEEAIRRNAQEFGSEEDTDPDQPPAGSKNEPDDDYDDWTVPDLEAEVEARDPSPEVRGTGKGGNVRKPDLIKALRLWDQEHGDDEQ